MAFDIPAAKAAGYTDAEIAEGLALRHNFDLEGARKHYSDGEISMQLAQKAVIPGGNASQKPKERGIIEKGVGAFDAAATVGTALVGAPVGALVGLAGGWADEAMNGGGTTADRNKRLEQSVSRGMQAGVWTPRTGAGADYVGNVGNAAKELAPLMGMAGVAGAPAGAALGAMGRIAGTAANAGRATLAEKLSGLAAPRVSPVAAQAMQATAQAPAAAQAARQAAPAMAEAPVGVADMSAMAATARKAGDGGLGAAAAKQTLANEARPNPRIVNAAERIGASDLMQPDYVTANPTYRQLTGIVKSSMPAGDLATAEARNLQAFATRASRLVEDLRGDTDLSATAGRVRTLLDDKQASAAASETKLWAAIRSQIDETAEVSAPQTGAALDEMIATLGGPERAAMALPGSARTFLQPLLGGEPITYGYLDLARKQVGEALGSKKGPFANMESGMLGRMYGTLTADAEAAAARLGTAETAQTLQLAKEATRLKKGLETDLATLFGETLQRSFVGAGDVSLPGAFGAASKGDASKVTRLMRHIPPELRESVAVSGMATYFRAASSARDFDFTRYASMYEGLMRNRQAYSAAVEHIPLSSRKQLEALYRVSRGISNSMATRIRTGQLNTVVTEIMGADGLMSNLYTMASRSGATMAAEAASSAVGVPGAGLAAGIASALTKGKTPPLQAVDALLASPEFMALVSATKPAEKAAAVNRLAASRVFNAFVQRVGRPQEIVGDPPGWIIEAMRPPPAAAFQQQQQQTVH